MRLITLTIATISLLIAGCSFEPPKKKERMRPKPVPQDISTPYDREQRLLADGFIRMWDIEPSPITLPPTGNGFSWEETLALALHHLGREADLHGTEKELFHERRMSSFKQPDSLRSTYSRYRLKVLTEYGILQLGKSPISPGKMKNAVSSIFKSEYNRDRAYNWMISSVKIAFGQLAPDDRRDYLEILSHAERYLTRWQITRHLEDHYLESLEKNVCRTAAWQKEYYKLSDWVIESPNYPCVSLFKDLDPRGRETGMRGIEVFIYDRAKEGWSPKEMRILLYRALGELAPIT